MALAPLTSHSSLGWNSNFTRQGNRSSMRFKIRATVNSTAVWESWPQACILPDILEA